MTKLNKKIDLSKYSKKIAELTNINHHGEVRLIIANLTCDNVIIELVKATQILCRLEGKNPIVFYTNDLYKRINKLGEKKYGEENWNKYIWNNC